MPDELDAAGRLYDEIGRTYTGVRRTEPRIAQRIWSALGDAESVLNVGAGTGSYEPPDREVTAVEPSAVMRAQRPPDAARCVVASAEALPFADRSFDAAMAILSDHHWQDRACGLRELRRVARRRIVVFTWDRRFADRFWLTRDYLPAFNRLAGMSIEEIAGWLGGARVVPVPIPDDCRDGFYHAFWRRPEAYLDERVRAAISVFARLGEQEVAEMVDRLCADLQSGAWAERNAGLISLPELDLGYRLVDAELPTCDAKASSTRRSRRL
jgi:SAM-dependent methyltransferase